MPTAPRSQPLLSKELPPSGPQAEPGGREGRLAHGRDEPAPGALGHVSRGVRGHGDHRQHVLEAFLKQTRSTGFSGLGAVKLPLTVRGRGQQGRLNTAQ